MSALTARALLLEGTRVLQQIRGDQAPSPPRLSGEMAEVREAFRSGLREDQRRPLAPTLLPNNRAIGGEGVERIEAELLLMRALSVERVWLYAHADDSIGANSAAIFYALIARRAAGEPLAYITGRREFFSLDLAVTPDVLIPRAETELLVELALQKIPQGEKVDIADLGTGSGAIALALAHERPYARVYASDASAAALSVAHGNAQRLGIDYVEFVQGDWCAAFGDRKFDVIVSNPPYIADADAHLSSGDLRFEPRAALASGADGLDAIRSIVAAVPTHLKPGGWLMLEHGFDQGPAVRDLLGRSGFVEVCTSRDLEQRERVTMARRGG